MARPGRRRGQRHAGRRSELAVALARRAPAPTRRPTGLPSQHRRAALGRPRQPAHGRGVEPGRREAAPRRAPSARSSGGPSPCARCSCPSTSGPRRCSTRRGSRSSATAPTTPSARARIDEVVEAVRAPLRRGPPDRRRAREPRPADGARPWSTTRVRCWSTQARGRTRGLVELTLPGEGHVDGAQVLATRAAVLLDEVVDATGVGADLRAASAASCSTPTTILNRIEIDDSGDEVAITLHADERMMANLVLDEVRRDRVRARRAAARTPASTSASCSRPTGASLVRSAWCAATGGRRGPRCRSTSRR